MAGEFRYFPTKTRRAETHRARRRITENYADLRLRNDEQRQTDQALRGHAEHERRSAPHGSGNGRASAPRDQRRAGCAGAWKLRRTVAGFVRVALRLSLGRATA